MGAPLPRRKSRATVENGSSSARRRRWTASSAGAVDSSPTPSAASIRSVVKPAFSSAARTSATGCPSPATGGATVLTRGRGSRLRSTGLSVRACVHSYRRLRGGGGEPALADGDARPHRTGGVRGPLDPRTARDPVGLPDLARVPRRRRARAAVPRRRAGRAPRSRPTEGRSRSTSTATASTPTSRTTTPRIRARSTTTSWTPSSRRSCPSGAVSRRRCGASSSASA